MQVIIPIAIQTDLEILGVLEDLVMTIINQAYYLAYRIIIIQDIV